MKQVEVDATTGMMANKIKNRSRLMYAFAIALDVLINNINNSLKRMGGEFDHEKKKNFNRLSNAAKTVDDLYERFIETILLNGSENYAEYDGFRKDANELIRLAMNYINCIQTEEDYQALMKFFDERKPSPEETLFDNDTIEMFKLHC